MTTLTEPAFVVCTGSTGPSPMWWEVCPPTTREHAHDVMHHLAELNPAAFRPDGHRRLRIIERHEELPTDELIAQSQAAREDLAQSVAVSQAARLFRAEKCPIPLCTRDDHPIYELCQDEAGHTWFQGEAR